MKTPSLLPDLAVFWLYLSRGGASGRGAVAHEFAEPPVSTKISLRCRHFHNIDGLFSLFSLVNTIGDVR